MVEQVSVKHKVVGSNPIRGENFKLAYSLMVEYSFDKREVMVQFHLG